MGRAAGTTTTTNNKAPSTSHTNYRVWVRAAERDDADGARGLSEAKFWRAKAGDDADWVLLYDPHSASSKARDDATVGALVAAAGGADALRWGALVERSRGKPKMHAARGGTKPASSQQQGRDDAPVSSLAASKTQRGAASSSSSHYYEWPRDALREAWRETLKPGDVIDAKDSEGRWFDSIVTEVESDRVKVHYKGWSSKWDAWLAKRDPEVVQKLFARTDDWRRFAPNDPVEVRGDDDKKALWYEARVTEVVPSRRPGVEADVVVVQTLTPHAAVSKPPPRSFPTDSEMLCKMGTHITRRALQRTSGATAFGSSSSSSSGGQQHHAPSSSSASSSARVGSSSSSSQRPGASSHASSSSRAYEPIISSSGGGRGQRAHVRGAPPAAGAVGLSNLGNTCFMNSMLQCLSHTQPLTQYFRQDDAFVGELNAENPLGSGGQIARAYADFVRDAWSGEYVVVVPSALKRAVGKHAPQFSGYQQQDSQELMNYLLDGLHEDLNRVRNKPYTETLESNGNKPDEAVAAESWRRFQLRNRSVVVDTCYGQLRSHITCPNCGHESITFDPYLSLSLPLPSATTRHVAVTLTKLDGSRPKKFVVAVAGRDTVAALKDALLRQAASLVVPDTHSGGAKKTTFSALDSSSGVSSSPARSHHATTTTTNGSAAAAHKQQQQHRLSSSSSKPRIDVCDIWAHRISRTFNDQASIEHIKSSDDLVAFELAAGDSSESSDAPDADDDRKPASGDHPQKRGAASYAASAKGSARHGEPAGAARFFRTVDVVFGTPSERAALHASVRAVGSDAQAQSRRGQPYELFGSPFRLAYDASTTCRAARATISRHVARFVRQSTKERQKYHDAGVKQNTRAAAARVRREAVSHNDDDGANDDANDDDDDDASVATVEANHHADTTSPSPYRVVVSGAGGTRFAAELERDETPLADAIQPSQTLTLEFSSDAVRDQFDRDEHDAVDLDASAAKRAALRDKDAKSGRAGRDPASVDIMDCFTKLAEREQLGETEQWYCGKCKQHSRAFKKLDLWSTPDVLIVHLKRFQYAQNMYFVHRQKLDDLVDFPLENLDLSAHVLSADSKRRARYDLFAVSEHSGGLGGGHYTATAYDADTKQWFHYNDASVSRANPNSVVSRQAYVLFYRRRQSPRS